MKAKKRQYTLIIIFILVMVVILGLVIIAGKTNQKEQLYYGETINRHPYHLYLLRDGTFDFVDPASSRLSFHNEGDRYQWNDGMLVLTFADSDKVWYLRQEGDTLVFDGDMSVLEGDDPRLKGVVFEKITE